MGKFSVVLAIDERRTGLEDEIRRLDTEIAAEEDYLAQKKARRAALAAEAQTFSEEAAVVRDRALAAGETEPILVLTDAEVVLP